MGNPKIEFKITLTRFAMNSQDQDTYIKELINEGTLFENIVTDYNDCSDKIKDYRKQIDELDNLKDIYIKKLEAIKKNISFQKDKVELLFLNYIQNVCEKCLHENVEFSTYKYIESDNVLYAEFNLNYTVQQIGYSIKCCDCKLKFNSGRNTKETLFENFKENIKKVTLKDLDTNTIKKPIFELENGAAKGAQGTEDPSAIKDRWLLRQQVLASPHGAN